MFTKIRTASSYHTLWQVVIDVLGHQYDESDRYQQMTLSLFNLNWDQLPNTMRNCFLLFYSQVFMGFSASGSSLFLTELLLMTIARSCYVTLLTLLKPPTHCCCLAIRPTTSLKVTLSLFRRQIFTQTLTTSSHLISPLVIHFIPSNQNCGYISLAPCQQVVPLLPIRYCRPIHASRWSHLPC